MSYGEAADQACQLRQQLGEIIFGQEELVTEALAALLAKGHILITGAPGLAKTTLVRVLAGHLGLEFGRVQFTPDLLPSDVTGSEVLNIDPETGKRRFEFVSGPVFVNFMLADEINRASPRTQSSLLEAMQERRVTTAGKVHALPQPFMVFATQNPFESEGTFPLPEAQLDRFLLHSLVAYPGPEAEQRILQEHVDGRLVGEKHDGDPVAGVAVLGPDKVQAMMDHVAQVPVEKAILEGIRDLVRSTRPEDELCPEDMRDAIWYGAGPRAGISLISAARSLALLSKEETVRWQHVQRMAKPVLRHRLKLTAQAAREWADEDVLIGKLLSRVEDRYRNLAKGIST